MNVEIEAKFKLSDPQQMRQRLLAAGAAPLHSVLEHNTYFDTPRQSLRTSDQGLRIRVMESPDGRRKVVMTYKGARQASHMKVRQEEETVIESADSAHAILTGLGYVPHLSFQKRRESFALAGARVEIDELPVLGFFLEIEAPDEATIETVRAMLGLENEPILESPYTALISRYLSGQTEVKPVKAGTPVPLSVPVSVLHFGESNNSEFGSR